MVGKSWIPLAEIARCKPIAAKLTAIRGGGGPVVFEHVTEPAQPFLAALIAGNIKKRIWFICENVRSQEIFYSELQNWFPAALFFSEMEAALAENIVSDPETTAERLEILQKLSSKRDQQIVVVTRASLDDPLPSPGGLKQISLKLSRSMTLDRDKLIAQLSKAGYESAAQVSTRGQYAVRGGIVDVFSWHHPLPVRVEFSDDQIDSIRQFDLDAQTSVQHLDTCTLLLGEAGEQKCKLSDYIHKDDLVISIEGGFEEAQVKITAGSAQSDVPEDYSAAFFDHGLGEFQAGDFVVEESKRERFFEQLSEWREEGWTVAVHCNNEGEIERLRDLIPPVELDNERFIFTIGVVARGFVFPAAKIAILSDAELFGRYRNTRARRLTLNRAKEQANRAQIDFTDLNEGDLVVHLEHGIGKYLGLQSFSTGEKTEETLVVEFANSARVYVPLEQSYLISRYIGVGKRSPHLSELGDGKWSKAKQSAERSVYDYATKLLAVHAERETSKGFAFAPDNKWQDEFERSFLYKETADQLTAIAAAKEDMESERPMDRLICGDVGFGKTEVAIRTAFKAVMNGKQVAILVPTTVLAQQHYQNFRERMSDYPVTIGLLSRFRTPAEQRKTIQGLKDGTVDIVVGTHRLISKDVQFKDLGLVVIDEEQRFGVLHKEKFKQQFKLVDLLTLSATPIPRTLYLSLMGAKDMSTLETPPMNRIPVETMIAGYDERIIRDAIKRELQRQGQVYFLHNRVQSIERVADRIRMLCPGARVEIGHGQMDEDDLEGVMQRFVSGATDVLVSTTIIESGLDIPNANTIIIDRADRFGLADLYQLRGRVGRAQNKAYAYLMLPRDMIDAGEARKRINAIKQYSSLGAGFKIAMRDLEIRGAGNILGTAQSGHIVAIGFDLYCQLLKQAIAKMKGEKVKPRVDVQLRLDFIATNEAEFLMTNDATDDKGASRSFAPAFLPVGYIEQPQTRIQAYRKLAEVNSPPQLEQLRKAWRDRFGVPPKAVENLLIMSEIKLLAAARKVTKLEVKENKLMLTRGGDFVLIGGKFPRLVEKKPERQLHELAALIKSF
ncbi:MAG: transcription-repair coupling factor [Chthoniobacteraceae bacterium]